MSDEWPETSEDQIKRWQQEHGGVKITDQDVSVLIGLMAELEGCFSTGTVDADLVRRVRDRFAREGLLDSGAALGDLCGALNALNHRLRTARGEYDVPMTRKYYEGRDSGGTTPGHPPV
jgi:hypothetical protein